MLAWSEEFHAADYFKYSKDAEGVSSSKSITASAIPYAAERLFSDGREEVEEEEEGVIPEMPEHPLFDCHAHYYENGSIFSVTFLWHQRGDAYSNLSVTAGHQAVELIQDCTAVELDRDGNIVPSSVTVTE